MTEFCICIFFRQTLCDFRTLLLDGLCLLRDVIVQRLCVLNKAWISLDIERSVIGSEMQANRPGIQLSVAANSWARREP